MEDRPHLPVLPIGALTEPERLAVKVAEGQHL
jgi:hypothetical protein